MISPILLAAGQSRRFGSDKLIYPLQYQGETKPLILHTLRPWLEVFSQVTVVIRNDNPSLVEVLENSEFVSQLRLIPAANADLGMSASFITGIEATKQADGWLIGLADMPYIHRSVINDSLQALQSGAEITLPEFNSRRGHPVGFASVFLSQLMSLTGDKGARDILNSAAAQITLINSPDDGICQDIDTRQQQLTE